MKHVSHITFKWKDFSSLPRSPGIYFLYGVTGDLIYIGMASSLKNRLTSHSIEKDKRCRIASYSYFVLDNITAAERIESETIARYLPLYNVRLSRSSNYHCIYLSDEEYSQVFISERSDGKHNRVFATIGPYSNLDGLRLLVRGARTVYPVRSCSTSSFRMASITKTPCIMHEFNQCPAPCVSLISRDRYAENIQGFLKLIKGKNPKKNFSSEIKSAIEDLSFEKAELLSNASKVIDMLRNFNSSYLPKEAVDIFSYDVLRDVTYVYVVKIRDKGIAGEDFMQLNTKDAGEIILKLAEIYSSTQANDVPKEILVNNLKRSIYVGELCFKGGVFRSWRKKLVEFANNNLRKCLLSDTISSNFAKIVELFTQLKNVCSIESSLKRVEILDISHTGGEDRTAVFAVLENCVFINSKHYISYRLKDSFDDLEGIKAAVTQRLKRKDLEQPDLILVDGGKAAYRCVKSVLQANDKKIELFALSKHPYILWSDNKIVEGVDASELRFLTDEAHRYANIYRRNILKRRIVR